MREGRFILMAALIVILQIIMTKYCQIGPFLYVTMLPAVILCMPTSRPTWYVMLIAFILGLVTDGLADGPLGLNAMALIPAAALQKPLVRFFIDEDCVERGYPFTFHRYGYFGPAKALAVEVLLFFILYVIFDSAGERSFGFNLSKILISSLASIVVGMVVCGILHPRQQQ